MAKRVPDERRAPAATAVWLMMIMGFAITAGVVGQLIDPYSPRVLLKVSAGLSLVTAFITALCLWGLEKDDEAIEVVVPSANTERLQKQKFKEAFREVWSEPAARTFTVFVFMSMLAYSAQDLILEPFAGAVHGFTPGQTTQLSGWHHMGAMGGRATGIGAGLDGGGVPCVGAGHGGFGQLGLVGRVATQGQCGVSGCGQRRVFDCSDCHHDAFGR
jgi:BCD family chlorophyll transporter-like MFS transporter